MEQAKSAVGIFVVMIAVGGASAGVVSADGDGRSLAMELTSETNAFAADTDGDGLDDSEEISRGTNPLSLDSDGDGMDDGLELNRYGTDPNSIDSDGDRIPDGTEIEDHGTDPTVADTDADGLADGTEITEHETDPLAADSDGDGLADGTEVEELDSDPAAADSDGDGLADGRERELGTDPGAADSDDDGLDDGAEIDEYDTDPAAADSDGDGLVDGRERGANADPLVADTDGDGVPDGEEVNDYGSKPTATDSDGDGLSDGEEVSDDPAMAEADPARFDVFVELDYMSGRKPSAEAIDMVVEEYADAPVENPDGSTGISLHVDVDDEIARSPTTNLTERGQIMAEHMDHDGKGYHYGVFAVDPYLNGRDVAGFSSIRNNNGAMVCKALDPPLYQANHFMHELGHSVGLGHGTYRGIDSDGVPYGEYSSVMNYNSGREVLGYSDGDPFDDWQYIEEHVYTPSAEDIGE
ncbi:hypothetical protein ACFQMA_05360 [Halosimplex aquaticum]|uniref:Thrombospondin type 3 repeat-containing protein n=1 Tax=Halosimplex aquaticum TaxID=3026162 RepID=A0ABD5Y0M9_9EURY|nr:hypothetical protein [Halosimplex aquaticum]